MARQMVKESWETYWKMLGLKDAPATQLIEMRRVFYAGFLACMTGPMNTEADCEACFQEILKFFEDEEKTGYGIPK